MLTMKLLSLHIDKYKNLSGDYDFTTQDGYIALIGENGSGKSNLLEAISLIFDKLYKTSNIEDIGKFRIRYEIDGTEYSYGNIDEEGNDVALLCGDCRAGGDGANRGRVVRRLGRLG